MTQNNKLIKNLETMPPIELQEVPDYYKGKNGYMAKDVVSNFDLSYNIGTAVTYLLRSKNKHNDGGVEDIRKAINHLHFELDRIHNDTL